jgi:hypothetical protein
MIFTKFTFKALIFHKNIAFFQRKAYNIQRTNNDFLTQILLIEIDFKQKIVIPMSPRQVNAEFYKLQQRSCLSKFIFAFKFKNTIIFPFFMLWNVSLRKFSSQID